jgi:hypothetical protein
MAKPMTRAEWQVWIANEWGKSVEAARAQKEWVGLTEEETQALYDRYAVYQEYGAEDSGWFDFARAIEAWLREKNT